MNCLVLSDTFPSRADPWNGPYNRRQAECLAALCNVTVIAPLPWPEAMGRPRNWGLARQMDDALPGIPLWHPLFWYVPVVGRAGAWRGLVRAAERALRRIPERFDVILATFAYPHGMAAKHLAARRGIPYVIKTRGSDLHSLPPIGARRDLTAEAVRGAAAIVAVSANLAEIAGQLGAKKVHLLPNGIDADRFAVIPREEARRRLGAPADRAIYLFVGSLLPVKGVDVLLEAVAGMDRKQKRLMVVAGEGPLRMALRRRIAEEGLDDVVRLVGRVSREQVALWMNAADALVLPSRNEGCPNVVMEALACGTPVVASRVGAVPDLLAVTSGIIVSPENPTELRQGMLEACERKWDREALRSRVAGMTWEANAARLHGILADTILAATR